MLAVGIKLLRVQTIFWVPTRNENYYCRTKARLRVCQYYLEVVYFDGWEHRYAFCWGSYWQRLAQVNSRSTFAFELFSCQFLLTRFLRHSANINKIRRRDVRYGSRTPWAPGENVDEMGWDFERCIRLVADGLNSVNAPLWNLNLVSP